MKPLATFFVVILLTFTARAQHSDAPPSLSLAKAASIAEAKLNEMKLPAEFYLRSIRYNSTDTTFPSSCYLVTYAPIEFRKADGDNSGYRYEVRKYIIVALDETVTVSERIAPNPRRIIIRPKPDSTQPSSPSVKVEENQ